MAEFEKPKYSKREVVKAGKVLRENIAEVSEEVIHEFGVAHNWRSSYAYPMHRIRQELRGKVSREQGLGVTAARLKRMSSIRKKLAGSFVTLYQMQDIAGARAILPDLKSVNRVSGYFEDGDTRHSIVKVNDYISSAKPDGYRSKHIILKFCGSGEDKAYDRQFVEVQLRTEKQHAWATAVEAVGLVRNEDLKAGKGDSDWLRFFALMSAEIARREENDNAKSAERREEILEIDAKINALSQLRGYNYVLRNADRVDTVGSGLFLISFDPKSRKVTVAPYAGFRDGSAAYVAEERGWRETNAVLVEVDRVRDLKSAYPNYFLDVQTFLSECEMSTGGEKQELRSKLDVSFVGKWADILKRRKRG